MTAHTGRYREVELSTGRTFEDALREALLRAETVILDRHVKYGTKNILLHGEYGVIIRLFDKLCRYENGLKEGHSDDFGDESFEDTINDLIGYACILRLLRAGEWELPMEGEGDGQ